MFGPEITGTTAWVSTMVVKLILSLWTTGRLTPPLLRSLILPQLTVL
ncbi:hypothetical protein JD844_013508, partial [Phrynosoma platyrhinos]